MAESNVVDLISKMADKPKTLGPVTDYGFTVHDLAFLSFVASQQRLDDPVKPRKREKAAAERLRKAGLLYRRPGAEEDGYILSLDGTQILEQLVTALARFTSLLHL